MSNKKIDVTRPVGNSPDLQKGYMWVIDQAFGQDGWILTKFFFCKFMDPDRVDANHKLAKKRMRPVSSHLDQTIFLAGHGG